MFRIKEDPVWRLQAFAQVMHNGQETPHRPGSKSFTQSHIPSDENWNSIVQRAYDDNIRDVRTITGLAKAIERMAPEAGQTWRRDTPSTQADVRAYKANQKRSVRIRRSHNAHRGDHRHGPAWGNKPQSIRFDPAAIGRGSGCAW
jgi:hypothetical protein